MNKINKLQVYWKNIKKMKNSFKRATATIAAMAIVGSGTAAAMTKPNFNNSISKNTIGHEDIGLFGMDNNDFVIFNVGDHDDVGIFNQDRKMKKCSENNISMGIIISSNSDNQDKIYNDVEYTKGLIAKYNIDFPVYLNIDEIMTNDNLSVSLKKEIINNFLEKCSSNNIYVGMYGTDTNLCRVREYCGIKDYDSFVVQDSNKILYDGSYNLYRDLSGNIKAKTDLSKAITSKKLNNKDGFVNDGAYIIKPNEDLTDISLKYGISVNELLSFNEISDRSKVSPGDTLRIPMLIDKTVSNNIEFERLDTPIRGCDISYAQGGSLDFSKLKENFEFIILKCSQGNSIDSTFNDNYLGCVTNNIPIGVYCFNDINKNDCEDLEDFNKKQKNQVSFTLDSLKNKKIDYPVYFDIEDYDMYETLPADYVNSMLDIWYNEVSNSGYIPGVYCNQSTFDYLQSCVDDNLADRFQIWLAGGPQYMDEETDNLALDEVMPSPFLNYDENVTMAQSTNVATDAGAEDSRGHLDINFSKIDYSNKNINSTNQNNFEIKSFNRFDYRTFALNSVGIIGVAGMSSFAIYSIYKKQKKKKKKGLNDEIDNDIKETYDSEKVKTIKRF